MTNPIRYFLLIALFLGQLAVPVGMVLKREQTLKQGVRYYFKTVPFVPYDAFRGRYVALSLEANRAPLPLEKVKRGEKVYVVFTHDEKGFAQIERITLQRPLLGDYLRVKVLGLSPKEVVLHLPFNRYYMEETAAPRAEALSRNVRDKMDSYLDVRIKDGYGVISGLFLNNRRIEDILKDKAV